MGTVRARSEFLASYGVRVNKMGASLRPWHEDDGVQLTPSRMAIITSRRA